MLQWRILCPIPFTYRATQGDISTNTKDSGEELPPYTTDAIYFVFEGGLEEKNVLSVSITEDRGVEARGLLP